MSHRQTDRVRDMEESESDTGIQTDSVRDMEESELDTYRQTE